MSLYTQHEQGFGCASFCYSSLEFLEFSEFYSSTCFAKLPNLLVSFSITKHPVCQFSGDLRRFYELSAEQGSASSELRLGDYAYYGIPAPQMVIPW